MSSTTPERIILRTPMFGYVLLLISLIAMSSMGAAMDLQRHVDPFLKLFWRSSVSLLVSIPFAMISAKGHSNRYPRITVQTIIDIASCCGGNAVFMMTFLWSLNHTSIGHAYIFNNAHSLIIVVGRVLIGRCVLRWEAIGTVVGILGGILATLDHNVKSSRDANYVSVSVTGDLVALGGAIGGVLYLIMAKRLCTKIATMTLLSAMFASTVLLLLPLFFLLKIPIELSLDDRIGLFGWATPSHLWSELYIVVVCTFVGTLGYISVMKYFDPIVVSVVMLLEPVLAHALGVVVGVEVMPGLYTFGGTALMILGTVFVLTAEKMRKELKNEAIVIPAQFEMVLRSHHHLISLPDLSNIEQDEETYIHLESPIER